MKKVLFIAAPLVVAVFVGMPYVTGVVAEKAISTLVSDLNQQEEKYGRSEIISYERGFSSTQARYKWTLAESMSDVTSVVGDSIEYRCDSKHGLLGITYQCYFDEIAGYSDFVQTKLGGKDPLSATGSVSLFGGMTQKLSLDAFSVDDDGGVVKSKPGYINVTSNKALTDFEFDGEYEGFTFSEGLRSADAKPLTLKGYVNVADDGLQTGNFSFSMAGFAFIDKSQAKKVELDSSKLIAQTHEDGDKINIDYSFTANKLTVEGNQQKHDIDNLDFEFVGKGFERSGFIELNEILAEIGASPEEAQPEQMAQLLPVVERLLQKDLSLAFTLAVDYQQQNAKAELTAMLIDQLSLADLSAVMFNPASLLDKMEVATSTVLPDSVVSLNPALAQKLQNSPIYERQGEAYKSSVILKKDDNYLNGESIEFNELLGRVMQSAL